MGLTALLLCLLVQAAPEAQRQLSWDALEVTARLQADGVLDVTEVQTIVFTGEWNGGERIFNLRPRQGLELVDVERLEASGRRVQLRENSSLSDVDDFAMTDARTLRWRSRRPLDAPFSNTRLTYAIRYRLSGILQKDGDRYVLDHDFAFPERAGAIARFTLQLALDPSWQPETPLQDRYAAGPLPPGRSYVLTIPLRFTGAGVPSANDGRRPVAIVRAVQAIAGLLVVSIAWALVRERRLGRFAPVSADGVDAAWIREHILAHPAEVVGAAWDESVGEEEVVALLARLAADGKIASQVHTVNKSQGLALELKVDRSQFDGYERDLIDGLFFNGRTRTSTEEVQAQYAGKGFSPATVITSGLTKRAKAILPPGGNPRVWPLLSVPLFVGGAGCLVREWMTSADGSPAPIVVFFAALVLALIGQLPGNAFRSRIDWGYRALGAVLLFPAALAGGVAWFLWNRAGVDDPALSIWMIGAVTLLTLWIVHTSINAAKSRQHRGAIAFRKTLAAAKAYFARELAKDQPALSDSWYPWIAAFGLARMADRWSVQHTQHDTTTWRESSRSQSSSSGSTASDPPFSGFGGGRSGGAGGGASWAAAAAGMAAGVAAPSSSSSSGGGSSSSGGSSGGGGGGGW